MKRKTNYVRLPAAALLALFLGSCLAACGYGGGRTESRFAKNSHIERDDRELLEEPMKWEGQIILRLADNQRADYPTAVACDYFADLVEERTEGAVKILTYHSSILGDEKSSIAQMRYGGIDMVRASIALLTDYAPQLTVLEMPYLYRDSEHMWQVLDSGIGDYFLKSMEKNGIEGLCWYDAGARNFYTTEKMITKPEDLEGLYIRVQQSAFMIDLISMLGANPVDLPYESVWGELRTRRIDGAENNMPSYMSTGHCSVAPYLSMDGHTRIPEMIVINKKVLESLPEEYQKIIRQAAAESSIRQRQLWQEEEERALKTFEEAGGIITYVEDQEAFRRKVQPIYDIYARRYGEILDMIREMGKEEEIGKEKEIGKEEN